MSGWHYMKSGMLGDTNEGPFSDQAFLQLAFEGKITPSTLVAHASHTKGQWVQAEKIPAARQKHSEGEQQRSSAKEEQQALRQQQKLEQQAVQQAERQRIIQEAAEKRASSSISAFLTDGQPEGTVARIYERVSQILTPKERIDYIAVQAKPVQIAPDCVVLTNRRLIVFRQKMLGQMNMSDCLWMYLYDAQLKEGILYGEISFRVTNGSHFSIDYLPKAQARRIYSIAQMKEEEAIETRRNRSMEETRAGASNIVVQAGAPVATASAPTVDDPVAKLQKLKSMLDAGLIEKDEYDATKARILAAMVTG